MNPIAFFRQLDYPGTRSVLVVQTAPRRCLPPLVARLREVFPGCEIEAALLAEDAPGGAALEGVAVEMVRPGELAGVARRLRRRRYDVVAIALHPEGPGELRSLPYRVRARSIVAFNENLDHFPLNVHRLDTIAHHFGVLHGQPAGVARGAYWLLRRAVGSVVAVPARVAFLATWAAWLHLRGAVRRRRRARQLATRAASAAR